MSIEMITGEDINSEHVFAVDIYSLAIIMWELIFEDSPYIYKKENREKFFFEGIRFEDSIYSKMGATNITYKTTQGCRPVLPFTSLESCKNWCQLFGKGADYQVLFELTLLMQQCWAQRPENRPTASTVYETLKSFKNRLK